jgi:hypothetical protein
VPSKYVYIDIKSRGPVSNNHASFNDPSYKLLVSRSMKKLVHKPAGKHPVPITVIKITKFCYGPQYDGLKNMQV